MQPIGKSPCAQSLCTILNDFQSVAASCLDKTFVPCDAPVEMDSHYSTCAVSDDRFEQRSVEIHRALVNIDRDRSQAIIGAI